MTYRKIQIDNLYSVFVFINIYLSDVQLELYSVF